MDKQAYYKLMGIDKKAANWMGPLAGTILGGYTGSHVAKSVHKNPGKLLKALYILGYGALGAGTGNFAQDLIKGNIAKGQRNYIPFIDSKTKKDNKSEQKKAPSK